jgi:hypothetical protein
MRKAAILFVLIAFVALAGLHAAPAETWIWYRTVSTDTEWWTESGNGEVSLLGNQFRARLGQGQDPLDTRFSLRGSVSGGLVTARVTFQESDAPVVEVSGRLKRLCWIKGGGREILILTNGEQVIGLFREQVFQVKADGFTYTLEQTRLTPSQVVALCAG